MTKFSTIVQTNVNASASKKCQYPYFRLTYKKSVDDCFKFILPNPQISSQVLIDNLAFFDLS